jgi:Desulfoferrodoxin, N-terminal domain
MANVVGKRYLCSVCNSEMIVTKGSPNGQLSCCGQPMQLKQ